MIHIFLKGGPIMWPLLIISIIALSVIIERCLFLFAEYRKRDAHSIHAIFQNMEKGAIETAIHTGHNSTDPLANILSSALASRETSFSAGLLCASSMELKRYTRGLNILDTIVTIAPLMGLMGTVLGMVHSFGIIGANELSAPAAVTGGVAEALIATAFGLAIAIISLIPYNYLNSKLEETRREIEIAGNRLELLCLKQASQETNEYAHRYSVA